MDTTYSEARCARSSDLIYLGLTAALASGRVPAAAACPAATKTIAEIAYLRA